MAQIASSIRAFGFTNPVLISPENDIIAGHGRTRAAAKVGLERVPCIRLGHLTETERRAYVIADNRLALNAGWDTKMLELELSELQADQFDLELLGFEEDELEALLNPEVEPGEGLTDPDAVPDVVDTRCKPGDLWVLGGHRLLCGDSTDVLHVERLMGGIKPEMAYCDPPYGADIVGKSGKLGGSKPFGNIGNMVAKVVKAGNYRPIIGDETTDTAVESFNICAAIAAVQVFWGAQYYADRLPPNRGWIVWDKQTDGSLGDGELAYSNMSKAVRIFQHKWSGMIKASEKDQRRVHPTQKPIALAEWCFENYGDPKTVVDLFLGSGSTLIACEKTGRRCFGMEIDAKYCDVILTRWEQFTGKTATLEAADG